MSLEEFIENYNPYLKPRCGKEDINKSPNNKIR